MFHDMAVQQQKTECEQTKMHKKAKLQNAPTFTENGSHIATQSINQAKYLEWPK